MSFNEEDLEKLFKGANRMKSIDREKSGKNRRENPESEIETRKGSKKERETIRDSKEAEKPIIEEPIIEKQEELERPKQTSAPKEMYLPKEKEEIFDISNRKWLVEKAILEAQERKDTDRLRELRKEFWELNKQYQEASARYHEQRAKKETPIPEKEKEKSDWEILVDSWLESKIQREMKKLGTPDRKIAEDSVKDRLNRILPRIFSKFAVHGIIHNKTTGRVEQKTDLDGKVCLGLLWLTGQELRFGGRDKNVFFIDYNERKERSLNLDVGQYGGISFLEKTGDELSLLELSDKERLEQRKKDKNFFFNLGAMIDHHPEGAPSTSGIFFKILDKFGFFDFHKKVGDFKYIEKMVEFVDLADSRGYQEIGKPENWNKSDRTILGLHRFLDFNGLREFIKDGIDFNKELSDEELKKYRLIYKTERNGKTTIVNRQEQQRKIIDLSNKKLEEFKDNGFIIDTKFGKIIIDAKNELVGGATAAQSVGAGYLKWDEQNKTLFMFANQELDKDLFKNGNRTRKYLWVMPSGKGETGLSLNKVIEKIGGQITSGSKLENYLREEKKEKPEKEKEAKEEKKEILVTEKEKKEKDLSLEEKIRQKEKELEEKKEKHGFFYGALGLFRRKPVIRDLGYYASEADIKKLEKELEELKKEKKEKYKTKEAEITTIKKGIPAIKRKLTLISKRFTKRDFGVIEQTKMEDEQKKLEKEKKKLEKQLKKLSKKLRKK